MAAGRRGASPGLTLDTVLQGHASACAHSCDCAVADSSKSWSSHIRTFLWRAPNGSSCIIPTVMGALAACLGFTFGLTSYGAFATVTTCAPACRCSRRRSSNRGLRRLELFQTDWKTLSERSATASCCSARILLRSGRRASRGRLWHHTLRGRRWPPSWHDRARLTSPSQVIRGLRHPRPVLRQEPRFACRGRRHGRASHGCSSTARQRRGARRGARGVSAGRCGWRTRWSGSRP